MPYVTTKLSKGIVQVGATLSQQASAHHDFRRHNHEGQDHRGTMKHMPRWLFNQPPKVWFSLRISGHK